MSSDPRNGDRGLATSGGSAASASSGAASPGAVSGPAGAPRDMELLMARMWERLFAGDGLIQCIAPMEARCCRAVCRDWRRLACDTVTAQELWRHDLGSARRGAAWKQLLLGGITLQQRSGTPQDSFEKLCETASPYDSVIRRDVSRTLPQEEMFRERNGKGQAALFRLLRALAIRLWDIGYCQSLNFIVATLIGVFPDDDAASFHCALALLLRHSLVDLYRPKFPKLGVVVWQFDRIVEGFLPKVHTALVRHGVNSEYYAIQWFLTLFASDLQQQVVRRVWDRFLVAGWRIVVQVGLALLYTVQDTLPDLETCHALTFLKKFTRTRDYDAEELLATASSFKVSHRMLSALEAAYNWEDDVQLLVIKDLNSGQVHWAVQAVPPAPPSAPPKAGEEGNEEEDKPIMPRAFSRGSSGNMGSTNLSGDDSDAEGQQGTVLPFLVHNLDTGESSILDQAWSQYTEDVSTKARAKAAPPALAKPSGPPPPSVGADGGPLTATGAAVVSTPMPREPQPQPPLVAGTAGTGGIAAGSFWTQSVQRQAVQRLRQA